MNGGLSKLGISLVAVFAACFIALVSGLSFVLWRRIQRRHFHIRDFEVGANQNKKILGFLCWPKKHSRIEPNETPPPADNDREGDDEMKWQEIYRSSRVLFTIREESEREGINSENSSSPEKEVKETKGSIGMVITSEEKETPFETPCSSPPYYTPPLSPTRKFPAKYGMESKPEITETAAWR